MERSNRTLKAMLHKHASRYGNEWDKHLYGKRRHVVGRPPKWVQALLQKGTAESHGDPDPRGADESHGDPDPPRYDESLTNGGVVYPDHPPLQRSDESLAEGSEVDPASTFELWLSTGRGTQLGTHHFSV